MGRPAAGARLRLRVQAMALDGDAVVRSGEYVLFVPGAIPGEEVEVEVLSAGRKYGRARLVGVLEPSPHRVAPPCPHFGPCGGCAWQHIAYPEQLRLKGRMLANVLELALGRQVPVGPTIGLEEPWGFRNKVHFIVGRNETGGPVVGHYGARSRELVPVEECRVHNERGNAVAFRLRDLLDREGIAPVADDLPGTGVARHILVRVSERTGEAQAVLVATRRKFPGLEEIAREITGGGRGAGRRVAGGEMPAGGGAAPAGEGAAAGTEAAAPATATGFHLNTNRREGNLVLGSFTRRIAGRERLLEEVGGVRFLISPVSFFQTSTRAAEKLVDLVLRGVGGGAGSRVLDLYAGAGLFALPLARLGHRAIAVEENPHAIEDGLETARFNRIRGVRFVRARVEDVIRRLGRRASFDAAILDPPREGATETVLAGLSRSLRPRRIVYVSCDPRALARDLRFLLGGGYHVEDVRAVDMFPQTAHIEAVAVLAAGRTEMHVSREGFRPFRGSKRMKGMKRRRP